jgi:hypothetical protein
MYQEHRLGRAVTAKGLAFHMVVRMPTAAKPERTAWWPRIVRARRAAIALARREM